MLHVTIAWEVRASGARGQEIDRLFKQNISNYHWVQALSNVVVVSASSIEQLNALAVSLINTAKSLPEQPYVFISPPMSGGRYNGFVPSDKWQKLNEITG